jgi:hypothetical protein
MSPGRRTKSRTRTGKKKELRPEPDKLINS